MNFLDTFLIWEFLQVVKCGTILTRCCNQRKNERKFKEDKTKTDRYVPEQVFIIILIIVNSIVKKVLLDQTK